jgi:hypothetical protein
LRGATCDEAIHMRPAGLLRFARNDAKIGSLAHQTVVKRFPCGEKML